MMELVKFPRAGMQQGYPVKSCHCGMVKSNLHHSYGVCGVVVSAHLSVKQKVEGSIPPNHPNPAHETWDCGL